MVGKHRLVPQCSRGMAQAPWNAAITLPIAALLHVQALLLGVPLQAVLTSPVEGHAAYVIVRIWVL